MLEEQYGFIQGGETYLITGANGFIGKKSYMHYGNTIKEQ